MQRFISELRQRGVLRALGLYIALIWLILQIADVVFPAFDIPDSTVRFVLFGAILMFPVVALFSWFYEFTAVGLLREEEVRESGVERKQLNRQMSVMTISALVLALGISLFFNVQQVTEGEPVVPDNVSLLIADAVNTTGDPIFNGVLEQALVIGLEGASFVNSAPRHTALRIADQISEGEGLSQERARLVALREGISLILVGEISGGSDGYELRLQTVDASEGNIVAEATSSASSKAAVLQAVAELTDQVREDLGDVSIDGQDRETFSAASLEAVAFYTQAQELARAGKDSEAVVYYEQAVEADPGFGRAYSGWALSEFNLGDEAKSERLWEKTLSMMEAMNERERYRTLGLYYSIVTNNLNKAIENYKLLVSKFPADGIGHNNLAVVYFMNREFDEAREEGAAALAIYPNNVVLRSNYALYSMYSGEFELADQEADKAIEADPTFHKAYLAKAIAALAANKPEAAIEAYDAMAAQGAVAASLANMGKADLALWRGQYQQAISILDEGIAADKNNDNQRGVQRKLVMKTQAQLALGENEAVRAALETIGQSDSMPVQVSAARSYIVLREYDKAKVIADTLNRNIQVTERAAADMIRGNIALAGGDFGVAVELLTASIAKADSWLTRYDLGRAYAEAGFNAEALSEFELCLARIGEASALGLDDQPTFHFTSDLHYWLGRTRAALGMQTTAAQALESYLELQEKDDSSRAREARTILDSLFATEAP
jgi:tetratricopeptide (TPR) repeat protein